MSFAKKFSSNLKALNQRPANSSKNDFGHVLVIGGDKGMGGAAIMAAEAAYRTGCGRVSVLTRKENITALLSCLPNAMTLPENASPEKIFLHKDVIVIGCGLGKSSWAKKLLKMALNSNLPKIIDADALNILSESRKKIDLKNSIITPHVGEASRLLGISVREIEKNREVAIKKLHEKFGATVVLKGSKSLVFGKENEIHQCHYGNPGMATAGMGDILSGVIGSLVAQHLENEKAAILGVNIHAFSADLVAKKQGENGMIPRDLLSYIPQIINQKIK
jgi:NAD(P)H-hydrate epimerase